MPKKLILISVMLFIAAFCHAQTKSGTIHYKVEMVKNPLDSVLNAKPKNETEKASRAFLKKTMREVELALPGIIATLKFNATQARFETPGGMKNDNGGDINSAIGLLGLEGIFFNDLDNNVLLHKKPLKDKKYIVKKTPHYDWKISKETKTIRGYTCHKATTIVNLNRRKKGKITAWFCPELPFQFGPIGFTGLPGLILGLKRNGFYFYADNIELSEKDKKVKKPMGNKVVTPEEWHDAVEKAYTLPGR